MKKIILTVAAVFAFGFANAQDKKETSEGFSKGDVFVTGALTLGSTNDKNADVKTSSFEIAPQLGYFVTENIAVGVKVGYSSNKTKTVGTTTSDVSGFGVGAFGRYYFTPASKFSLFGQLGFDYGSLTNNLSTPKVKLNTTDVNLGLGLNYFVSSNFSLEAGVAALSFGNSKTDLSGDKGDSSFSFGGDWRAVSFGVNYKF
jgi:outer membrane protein